MAAAPRAKVPGLGPLGGLAPVVPGVLPLGVGHTVSASLVLSAQCRWEEGCQALEGTEATWGHCFWLKLGRPFGQTVPFAQP